MKATAAANLTSRKIHPWQPGARGQGHYENTGGSW